MRFYLRRFVLGLGAVLIVLGWGATGYADARQEAVDGGKSEALTLWVGESTRAKSYVQGDSIVPTKTLYTGGLIGMAVGAALLVGAFPRGSWQPHP